jgi:hypothetical protein
MRARLSLSPADGGHLRGGRSRCDGRDREPDGCLDPPLRQQRQRLPRPRRPTRLLLGCPPSHWTPEDLAHWHSVSFPEILRAVQSVLGVPVLGVSL